MLKKKTRLGEVADKIMSHSDAGTKLETDNDTGKQKLTVYFDINSDHNSVKLTENGRYINIDCSDFKSVEYHQQKEILQATLDAVEKYLK